MSFEQSAILLSWIAIGLLAFGMSGLLRQIAALRHGPDAGTFTSSLVSQHAPEIEDLEFSQDTVILFGDSNCPACRLIWPIAREHTESRAQPRLVIVTKPDVESPSVGDAEVFIDASAFESFRIPVTPFAVLVDRTGVIRAAEPMGAPELFASFLSAVQAHSADIELKRERERI